MRILKLRLLNLNSLAGEWSVDFSHPAYHDGGILAITGPTGVGKTTLLDAICLALYGATPRLGRIAKGANEIMTRGEGECAAELTFATPSGRYRVHWSQRRARKKPDGPLQDPRHEIADDKSGRVLESSLTRTLQHVEEITGLNFHQFTRSALLAQGAFAAFLEAEPRDRADLLEQLTGTELYGEISRQAHERRQAEYKILENLKRDQEGVARPGEAAISDDELRRMADSLTALHQELERRRAAAAWLAKLAELETESRDLAVRAQELSGQKESFGPDQKRLARSRDALRLAGAYERLGLLRQKRDRAEEDVKSGQAARPALEKARGAAAGAAQAAQALLTQARRDEDQARPVISQVRTVEVTLRENEARLAPLEAERRALAAELATLTGREFTFDAAGWSAGVRFFEEARADLAQRQAEAAARRQALAGLWAGQEPPDWRARLGALHHRLTELKNLNDDLAALDQARKDLAGAEQRRQKTQAELAAARADLASAEKRVKGLEREAEHLAARWNLQERLRSLEKWRPHLHDGQPCPLCGALEHPYAEPGRWPADEVAEADLAKNRADLHAARQALQAATARESRLRQLAQSEAEAADRLADEGDRFAKQISRRAETLGLDTVAARRQEAVLDLARADRAELTAVENRLRQAEALDKELARLEREITALAATIEKGERVLQEAAAREATLEGLNTRRKELRQERAGLFGDRDPDAEEKRLRAEVLAAEKNFMAKDQAGRAADEAWAKGQTMMTEAAARRDDLAAEAQAQAETFQAELAGAGFADEPAFLAAALPPEERERLERHERELAEAQAGLTARQKDNETRLARERERRLTAQTRAELTAETESLTAEHQNLQAQWGAARARLAEHQAAAQKYAELSRRIEAQEREFRRWDRLRDLIGSADGQKYRAFAQGLTFEILVHQANRQLVRLSDRYLLLRDPERPLELKIMDNYQAGEIRSTKNLSGGESFLVSLALALGLAQMASQRVRVDTLFLDEGFGTLDEEALDQALDALAGLRADGKLIGVISHVQALVARVGTRIQVRQRRGPHSELLGPGVAGGGTY